MSIVGNSFFVNESYRYKTTGYILTPSNEREVSPMVQYYEVVCKGGHVGSNNYFPMHLFIAAENGREAAAIARQAPRVKHDRKDSIMPGGMNTFATVTIGHTVNKKCFVYARKLASRSFLKTANLMMMHFQESLSKSKIGRNISTAICNPIQIR